MTDKIPPSFTDSRRKEVLERLRDDKLREGDLVIIKAMGKELLKAEMWDSISKEDICQEYFEVIENDLLMVISHAVGQKKGASVTSKNIDELASELMEKIMSAFVDEVDKTPALGEQYFIDDSEELTFDCVVRRVSELITQLHEERSATAIPKAISGLDPSIQNLVKSHFKNVGLI